MAGRAGGQASGGAQGAKSFWHAIIPAGSTHLQSGQLWAPPPIRMPGPGQRQHEREPVLIDAAQRRRRGGRLQQEGGCMGGRARLVLLPLICGAAQCGGRKGGYQAAQLHSPSW